MEKKPVGPVEALKIALAKEIEAAAMYAELARDHKVASDVFLFLVNEETKHRQLIEKKIAELTHA